ncbi:MAG: type VI secretion system tip protein VgrG, partial [Ketobacteraceae bacterium]|nr:type VI secretion system tip protein VgrG [Ketobacteraceae bacterium]
MGANTATFLFEVIGSNEDFNVLEFTLNESVSGLFSMTVAVAAQNPGIDLNELSGKPGVLTLLVSGGAPRVFHGELVQAEQQESGQRLTTYTLTLVPKFWLLQHRKGCRIFQDQSVPELIRHIFEEAHIEAGDFRLALSRTYARREYCVQYHESEFHFLSRLMEEEGLFYFFEHHPDR